MKAIVQHRYGDPDEVLEFRDVPEPEMGENEVLVRVHASAVSIGDWLIAHGLPYIARPGYGFRKPRHPIAGQEFSGEVEAADAHVSVFSPGDRVFGWAHGSLAERVSVRQSSVALTPTTIEQEGAAAVPTAAFTALQALRDAGGLREGQRVLVLGASGAVGTFAVQIAKALGAHVTGVCGTRNVEMVRHLGADSVIDYTSEEIGGVYDLVLDLAGNRPLSTLRGLLTPRGTLVIVGGSGGPWLMGFGRTLRAIALSPFVGQRLRPVFSKPNPVDLMLVKGLIEAGKVEPVVDRTYPLEAAKEAIAHVGQRHARGRTVVTV